MSELSNEIKQRPGQEILSTSFSININDYMFSAVSLALDYLAIVMAFLSLIYCTHTFSFFFSYSPPSFFSFHEYFVYLFYPFLHIIFMKLLGLYTKNLEIWTYMGILFKACVYVNILFASISYTFGHAETISPVFCTMLAFFCFTYLFIAKFLAKKILISLSIWQQPAIIVGAGCAAEMLEKSLTSDVGVPYKIAGIIDDMPQGKKLLARYDYLGPLSKIENILKERKVHNVIIAIPSFERSKMLDLIYRIQPYVKNLIILPDLYGMPMSNIEVETIFDEKTIMLKIKNNLAAKNILFFKRVFDLLASIIISILISPLLLAIICAIGFFDKGPIFFSQDRIGFGGKIFRCYKFRTMLENSQSILDDYLFNNPEAQKQWRENCKLQNDPRVTVVGKLLRKTSMDELPQLLNVIKGEMSLVGPRPLLVNELEKYGQYINDYYSVLPGITGYWQISGRSSVSFNRRAQLDSWYMRNWSFWLDIVILLKTIRVVLTGKGAY